MDGNACGCGPRAEGERRPDVSIEVTPDYRVPRPRAAGPNPLLSRPRVYFRYRYVGYVVENNILYLYYVW